MKFQKRAVTLITLILVAENQCGVIDNIYGRVKNTTSAITQDVKNVWSYSKSIVGLESKSPNDPTDKPEEVNKGVICSMVQSARDTAHSIRSYFWNTDEHSNSHGLIGNIYNHAKNKLFNIKGSVLGHNNVDTTNEETTQPLSEKTKLIRDTLNKLFFRNGTRQVHGRAFKEAIENLRNKIHEIKKNITASTTVSPVHHGEGLIDVRTVVRNVTESVDENTASINSDIYDKVGFELNEVSDKTVESYKNIKENIGEGIDSLNAGFDNAASQFGKVKDKAADATARENELLKKGVDNFNDNAQRIGSKVKNSVDDVRLSYLF